MKKIIIAFAFISFLFCSSCSNTSGVAETTKKSDRFVKIEHDYVLHFAVVYDKETLVMYTVTTGRYNQGDFTVLLDTTGKPLTYNKKTK